MQIFIWPQKPIHGPPEPESEPLIYTEDVRTHKQTRVQSYTFVNCTEFPRFLLHKGFIYVIVKRNKTWNIFPLQ